MALASQADLEAFTGQSLAAPLVALVLNGVSAAVLRIAADGAVAWTSATVPDDVRLVVLQVSARALGNPMQNASETIGAAAYTTRVTGVTLSADEIETVRYAAGLLSRTRPTAMSVPYDTAPVVSPSFVEIPLGGDDDEVDGGSPSTSIFSTLDGGSA